MWGILGLEVFHEEFPPFIIEQQLHINALELLTIVVALKVWGKRLRRKMAPFSPSMVIIDGTHHTFYFVNFRDLSL